MKYEHAGQSHRHVEGRHREHLLARGCVAFVVVLTVALGFALLVGGGVSAAGIDSTVRVSGNREVARANSSMVLDAAGNPVVTYIKDNNGAIKVIRCGDADCLTSTSGVIKSRFPSDTSVQLDAVDRPIVAYSETISGDLVVTFCEDTLCGSYTQITLDPYGGGGQVDMVLASDGSPVIGYANPWGDRIRMARCGDPRCTSVEVATIDNVDLFVRSVALVLDSSGRPVLAYHDTTGVALSRGWLTLARCEDLNCAASTITRVDTETQVYSGVSLQLGVNDNPIISYHGLNGAGLKIAACGDPTCSLAAITTVDGDGDMGLNSSMVLDTAGNPAISYHDAINRDLKVARCADPSCQSAELRIVAAEGAVSAPSVLRLDSADNPVISFADGPSAEVRLTHCAGPTCIGVEPHVVGLPSDGVYYLRSPSLNNRFRYIDADTNGAANLSNLPMSDDRWELINVGGYDFTLRNLDNDRYLDADADSSIFQSSVAAPAARWRIVPNAGSNSSGLDDDTFYLFNVEHAFGLEAREGPFLRGDIGGVDTRGHRWSFVPVAAPELDERPIALRGERGRWLDADYSGLVGSSQARSGDDTWFMRDIGDGTFYIVSALTGGYLDADGTASLIGTSSFPEDDDRWLFEELDDDTYQIRNVAYDGYLTATGYLGGYTPVLGPLGAGLRTRWRITDLSAE